MDNIIEPNDQFDFNQITLAQPTAIQGGAYFTKILLNGKQLYIQSPKSLSRQGFVKSGKKIHCDLMFDNADSAFIEWMENLETKCQKLIFEKSDSWFETALVINDIESAFNSPIKVYKSGKYYLLRTNVKVNGLTGMPMIKVYNEDETPLSMDDVAPETNMISIVEVLGIKFTSRNFQIEMDLKQSMIVNTDAIFESCLIKTNHSREKKTIESAVNNLENVENVKNVENAENVDTELVELDTISNLSSNALDSLSNQIIEDIKQEIDTQYTDLELDTTDEFDNMNADNINAEEITIDIEDLDASDNNANELNELNEVGEIELTNNLETITLKKPNQVYYEIYNEALKKAKEAKKNAVIAYLEAKNIKKTYLLEDNDSSDESDLDNLSDISETELQPKLYE